jgi:hypothetical protein
MPLQRGGQGRGDNTDDHATPSKPKTDHGCPRHPGDHPLQIEDGQAIAGGSNASIAEEPRRLMNKQRFIVVPERVRLNATELSVSCREGDLFPKQVERWPQVSQDANEKPVLTL